MEATAASTTVFRNRISLRVLPSFPQPFLKNGRGSSVVESEFYSSDGCVPRYVKSLQPNWWAMRTMRQVKDGVGYHYADFSANSFEL
ncbi:hypothetical protein TIFTF001_042421 [Ficus carica]|uniref:Uncharacterized protein n=1 Tax=Ficus carica TaxID=3494 RepID=A0AA88D018_FICCA|nr:hypothetical protein TIFTF001_042421 [Ficus carica]